MLEFGGVVRDASPMVLGMLEGGIMVGVQGCSIVFVGDGTSVI